MYLGTVFKPYEKELNKHGTADPGSRLNTRTVFSEIELPVLFQAVIT